MRDRMVCATRRSHPAARRRLTVGAFLKLRHIRVVQHPGDVRFVDEALRAQGLRRNVVATLPHWLVALHAVAGSDLAVAVSERLARSFDAEGRLAMLPLPIGAAPFDWQLYWHARHDAAPAQRWMRTLMAEVCAGLARP